MPQPQPAVFAEGTQSHWFLHYRLVEGAELGDVRAAVSAVRGEATGITPTDAVNLAVGFGPDKPVANNKSAGGRKKNRRTEFKLTQPDIAVEPPAPPTP